MSHHTIAYIIYQLNPSSVWCDNWQPVGGFVFEGVG